MAGKGNAAEELAGNNFFSARRFDGWKGRRSQQPALPEEGNILPAPLASAEGDEISLPVR